MNKIKQKEFIDALISGEFAFVGFEYRKPNNPIVPGFNMKPKRRTVTKKTSNHLEFSDDSRLYFDGKEVRTYYKDGNCYIMDIQGKGCNFSKVLTYYIPAKGD